MRSTILTLFAILLLTSAVFADTYDEIADQDCWIWPDEAYAHNGTELRTNRQPTYDQEILIQWDLSSIEVASTVNSATMYAYCYDGMYGVDCELFRITESWDEATVVNAIAHDTGTAYGPINVTGVGWYDFDIPALVQDWVDETEDNYGIVFYGTGGTGYYMRFCSKEYGSNEPYLEIDYDLPVGVESASLGNIKATFK